MIFHLKSAPLVHTAPFWKKRHLRRLLWRPERQF
jgi:hypothetical protein